MKNYEIEINGLRLSPFEASNTAIAIRKAVRYIDKQSGIFKGSKSERRYIVSVKEQECENELTLGEIFS